MASLNAAYDELKKLSVKPETVRETEDRPAGTQPPSTALDDDDLVQLLLFADEVDDVLRRVAALQVRLDRSR